MNTQSQPPHSIDDPAIDDPDLFRALAKKPNIAWPTIMLLIAAFVITGLSTWGYLAGVVSLFWAIVFNTIASYMSFTPTHDLQSPVPFYRTFRFIHMQHHRFTNEKSKDPDLYTGTGPRWLLPLKWATLDLNYFHFYFIRSHFIQRPKAERRELYLIFISSAIIITAITLAGWLTLYLLLFFIPQRITAMFIAVTFDYLPHYPHHAKGRDQPFQSTSNRVGMEWLLTPILLYQNYHLVHHLYPTVPFYRYIKIWKAKKHYHESQNPATTDAFAIAPRPE